MRESGVALALVVVAGAFGVVAAPVGHSQWGYIEIGRRKRGAIR